MYDIFSRLVYNSITYTVQPIAIQQIMFAMYTTYNFKCFTNGLDYFFRNKTKNNDKNTHTVTIYNNSPLRHLIQICGKQIYDIEL